MTSKPAYLHFLHRDQYYVVNRKGEIRRHIGDSQSEFYKDWILIGFSTHHWRNSPDISLEEAFKKPASIVGTLVWDKDHGTFRVWGGRYAGKVPRVRAAWVNDDPKV